MSTTYKWIVAVVVVILIIAGVWYYQGNKKVDISDSDNNAKTGIIKIGYIGPLTGPSAVLGMDAIKALEIARDEINSSGGVNGAKIEIIAEDDQYLSNKTVDAYNKLVNSDGVKIILAANYGGVFAIKDRAKQDGVVIIDPLDCNSELADANNNIFCLATETESIGRSLATYLGQSGKKKAAIMYSTKDSFMALVTNSFKQKYSEFGGQVLEQNYMYSDSDFRTSLTKIKNYKPDALVILGHDEQGTIMKQATDLGIKVQFMTTGTITSPGAQQASGNGAEGTIFAYWEGSKENSNSVAFEQKFTQVVGRGPILPLTTHPAYDSIMILAKEVLPKVSDLASIDQIKTALLNIQGYQGITGSVSFDQNGAAKIPESVYKLVKSVPVKI